MSVTETAAQRARATAGTALLRRMATAAVGAPVIAAAAWLGDGWLLGLVGALAMVGLWEAFDLAARAGAAPARPVAAAGVILLLAAAAAGRTGLIAPIVAGLVLAGLAAQLFPPYRQGAVANAAATVLAALYVGYLFSFLLLTRRIPDGGREALLLTFAVIWATDTAAYFVGLRWGRRPLLPAVSPGKTVEGGVAGLVAGVAGGVLVAWVLRADLDAAAILAACVSVLGQVGDLTESALKRSVGAKDAGAILPGHGGVLDRFDGLLFAAPVAYYLARFLG